MTEKNNIKETEIKTEAPKEVAVRKPEIDKQGRAYATGKRKNSIARVWLEEIKDKKDKKDGESSSGGSLILINGKKALEYLKRPILVTIINQPFEVTNTIGKYKVVCTAKGGGLSGQAGAVRHGIAVALQRFNPSDRDALKKAGLLTRDPRVVERKKPGRKKARKGRTYKKR